MKQVYEIRTYSSTTVTLSWPYVEGLTSRSCSKWSGFCARANSYPRNIATIC